MVIKMMYENYVCCVSYKDELQVSDPFPTWSGVKQGSLLSPLFILALDELMEK
jgi:hypothetical protein